MSTRPRGLKATRLKLISAEMSRIVYDGGLRPNFFFAKVQCSVILLLMVFVRNHLGCGGGGVEGFDPYPMFKKINFGRAALLVDDRRHFGQN